MQSPTTASPERVAPIELSGTTEQTTASSRWSQRGTFIGGMVVFIAAVALYVPTVAPSVMPGDYAEFQLSAAVLGVPHPTGYPLYIMLGKLFTLLPFGDVAYRVNLSSALYMAASACVLYAVAVKLLRRLGLGPYWPVAVLGAFFFVVAPIPWSMALVARSYALNALLVGGVVFCLITWRETRRPRWFYASCLMIGLSMVHHGTNYLLLPAYALFLLLTEFYYRHNAKPSTITHHASRITHHASRFTLGAAAFLLGLTPLLFLVYRFLDGSPYYWGNPTTWKDFFNLLTGKPFQGQVMAYGWDAQWDRFTFGLGQLADQYNLLGIVAGLFGLALLWRYTWREALLFTLMIAANFFFSMNYAIVGYVYFIPTYLLWAVLVSIALGWIARLVVTFLRKPLGIVVPRIALAFCFVALLGVALYAASTRYSTIDQSGQTSTRDSALSLLKTAPPHSSLYLDWEDLSVMRFYRLVYGMRPDLMLYSGDPVDWAKGIYCDLSSNSAVYVGKFAGTEPAIIARDFSLEPAPVGWRVVSVTNSALYATPPCGTCATCR